MADGGTVKTTTSWGTGFREVVAAGLGIIIVLAVLILMWPSLTKSPPDTSSAQGIFAILGGWGGIIIGYYFGRLPSEKAADKASAAADTARNGLAQAVKERDITLANTANLLANHAQSLRENKQKLETAKQGAKAEPTATGLDNAIKAIDAQIEKTETERQKLLDKLAK